MSILKNRVIAVVAGTAVLGFATTTGAVAAKAITGADIKNFSITSADLASGSVTSAKIQNGTISATDLNADLKAKINASAKNGTDGKDGKDGKDGAALADSFAGGGTIVDLGGSFKTRKTEVGTINLPEAGTYMINAFGFFDTVAADSVRTDGTHLQLAVRGPVSEADAFGQDFGTCFTSAFPAGDREATCQSVRVITVTEATELTVIGFGYNDDQSSTGSGSFTVTADVSAIKVG
ncbi:hypothetical protein [Nocardioides sp. Root140]|uniref:hypothetical protein n=1 Tax=Nocardioides sp. Root140 TaxID=1736460 RepID=UPI0006F904CD|nr:hypothetical protein [Nocardioides sp. Root140]KQY64717.1 hypothetical protein ASD30_07430 [Nocardioides sp. Root140]